MRFLKTVLSIFHRNQVQFILLGGQAVVAYGASQFTRDADFWIIPTEKNGVALKKALKSLQAKQRFLPPLEIH